jgi:pyruvate formate lyase activating enzyme
VIPVDENGKVIEGHGGGVTVNGDYVYVSQNDALYAFYLSEILAAEDGGEVLCHTEFAIQLAQACHEEGISVAIETNLSMPYDHIRPLLDHVDVIMADLKLFDEDLHKQHTGISNRTVLENIRAIRDIPMIIRTPLIPGVTATEENLLAIAGFLAGKENLVYYQLLNFNPLGGSKYRSLDTQNSFAEAKPYTPAEMAAFGTLLASTGVTVKVGE